MIHEFTTDDLKNMHLGLITRERVIRDQWIPATRDKNEALALMVEADSLASLGRKVCAAQLSMELGFYVPVAVPT